MKNSVLFRLGSALLVFILLFSTSCAEEETTTQELLESTAESKITITDALTPEAGKYYYIKNVGSGKFLTRGNDWLEHGRSVMGYQLDDGSSARVWKIEEDGDGQWYLKNWGTGDYLTIPDDIYTNGSNAIVGDLYNLTSQKWDVLHSSSGTNHTRIRNAQSGKLLETGGFQTGNGALIIQWDDNDHDFQKWTFHQSN